MMQLQGGARQASKGMLAIMALFVCAVIGVALGLAPATAHADGSYARGSSKVVAQGKTFKAGGNTYKVTDVEYDDDDLSEVRLVKFGSNSKSPKINTVTYKGVKYAVDSIGANAFNNAKGHKITSVTLGYQVDYIGSKAFYGCKKLKTINMVKCDVVDIDRGYRGYYIDGIDVGSKAFTKAGVSGVKVKCGVSSSAYRKVFKQALVKRGLRSNAKVVK